MRVSGLDLGKKVDPAAFVSLEQTEGADTLLPSRRCWHYLVCDLRQWPLGTPYTTIGQQVGVCEDVCAMYQGAPLQGSQLAVDQTGVGGPVVDLLRAMAPPCVIVGITQTGGLASRRDGFDWHVSKAELVSLLVSLSHSGRLTVEPDLPLAPALRKQFRNFKEKQTPKGNLTWEADLATDHDDLIMALATACWLGERSPPLRRGDIGTGKREAASWPAGTFLRGGLPKRW